PHRISLPTYPFARQRYWIPTVTPRTCSSCGLSPDRREVLSLRTCSQPTTGSLAAPEEQLPAGEGVYPDLLPTIPLGQLVSSTSEQRHPRMGTFWTRTGASPVPTSPQRAQALV